MRPVVWLVPARHTSGPRAGYSYSDTRSDVLCKYQELSGAFEGSLWRARRYKKPHRRGRMVGFRKLQQVAKAVNKLAQGFERFRLRLHTDIVVQAGKLASPTADLSGRMTNKLDP